MNLNLWRSQGRLVLVPSCARRKRNAMHSDPRLRAALMDLFEFRMVHVESPLDALRLLDMVGGHGEVRSSTTHWTLTYDPPDEQHEGGLGMAQ